MQGWQGWCSRGGAHGSRRVGLESHAIWRAGPLVLYITVYTILLNCKLLDGRNHVLFTFESL